jgi:predicted Zn-dependent peptidase
MIVVLGLAQAEADDDLTITADSSALLKTDSLQSPTVLYPAFDSALAHWSDPATYGRRILDNGLTILVKTIPDSGKIAVCIAGINRTGLEPAGKTGITYFLNQCLRRDLLKNNSMTSTGDAILSDSIEKESQDAPELTIELFNSRSHSFLGIETDGGNAGAALDRLTALLIAPRIDSETVEVVRKEILDSIDERTGSTACAASDLYYHTLLENHPLAEPILGTRESVTLISADDLRSYGRRYYSPNNMIMAIVGGRDSAEVFAWVQDRLSDWPPAVLVPDSPPRPESQFVVQEVRAPIASDTVTILAGGLLPRSLSDDALPLRVAATILEERLQNNFLERLGLGFGAKAEAVFDLKFGWYYLLVVTGSGNYRTALNRMTLQTEKLALDGPSASEVARAREILWSSYCRDRNSLSAQAHQLALGAIMSLERTSDTDFLSALSKVEVADVRRVAARYFRPDLWIIATAGRIE